MSASSMPPLLAQARADATRHSSCSAHGRCPTDSATGHTRGYVRLRRNILLSAFAATGLLALGFAGNEENGSVQSGFSTLALASGNTPALSISQIDVADVPELDSLAGENARHVTVGGIVDAPAVAPVQAARPPQHIALSMLGSANGNIVSGTGQSYVPGRIFEYVNRTQQERSNAAQQAVTEWLARKYRISSYATAAFVNTAYSIAHEMHLDPLLILSVIAIESAFNPYAESAGGAQGLMQVMYSVHRDKFAPLGGSRMALNPAVNIRVGAMILKAYVKETGSVEQGLKRYVGAAAFVNDSGYGHRVLNIYRNLKQVARVSVPSVIEAKTETSAANSVPSERSTELSDTAASRLQPVRSLVHAPLNKEPMTGTPTTISNFTTSPILARPGAARVSA